MRKVSMLAQVAEIGFLVQVTANPMREASVNANANRAA